MTIIHEHAKVDFGLIAADAISDLVASGKIELAIRDTIEKTVKGVIERELRDYSEFGKALGAAVSKSLAIHGDIDLPSYNDTILNIVRLQLETETHAVIQQQVAARMKELLQPVPVEIPIEKLVDAYREHLKESMDSGCVCHGTGEFMFRFKREDWKYGSRYYALDFSESSSDKTPDVHVGLSSHGGATDGAATVYHLRFGSGDVESKLFSGPFYAFERMLFQMKAANTKITGLDKFDEGDVDTSIESHD